MPASSSANRTLSNGLRLLEVLASEYREFSIAELGAGLGLPKSHVHRLLQTLVEAGLVLQSPGTRRYRVGFRLLELAGSLAEQMPLRRQGRPVLRNLTEAAKNSSYLIVPDGNSPLVMMTDVYKGRKRSGSLGLGERLSPHASAAGKLFLAYNRIPFPRTPLERISRRTITNSRLLRQELRGIRDRGYSVNREENTIGLFSFAAPVFAGPEGPVAAVGLAVPGVVIGERGEAEFIQLVLDAAETLARQNLC